MKKGHMISRLINHSATLFPILTILCSLFILGKNAQAELNCNYIAHQPAQNNPKEIYKKGYCQVAVGMYGEGIKTLSGLQNELTPIGDYILYYKAVGYKGLGDLSSAEGAFNEILSKYPTSGVRAKALNGLGEIYNETGNYVNAERVFNSLFHEAKDRRSKASYLNSLSKSLEGQKRYSEALNAYKRLWVEYPDADFANFAYGRALDISKNQSIPFAIEKTDYLIRADILFDNSRWSSAIESFNRLTKTDDIKIKMAISMFHLGSLNEAVSLLETVQSPESLFWMGKISAKQGLDEKASQSYRQIHLSYPQSPLAPEGLYNAARLYQINDEVINAINMYDELMRKYPNSEFAEDGAWNLGWIYYKQGKINEALATFSAYTNSSSAFNSSNNKYWKAKVLEKLGRKEEAFQIYRELAESKSPSYHSYLSQRKTGIKPSYRSASIDIYTQSESPRRAKADLLIQLEIHDDAVLEIDKMLEESSTDQDLLQVSMLYANAKDFYNSIKVVQDIKIPQANVLSYPRGYSEIVRAFSKKYNIDEYLVYSVIREESRFQKNAVSPASAIGLMQLMPATARLTAREVGLSGFNTDMLNVPRVNIEFGIYYLNKVLSLFNGDIILALASYNAGPQRAEDWIARFPNLEKDEFVEEVPFRETRNYIRRILRSYGVYKALYD